MAYEPFVIPFTQPAKARRYTPDFILANYIIIEAKGEWKTADRQKMEHVMACHPDLDIRFVFARPRNKIGKKSKTRYMDYCEQRGWWWAEGVIPTKWLLEPARQTSVAAVEKRMRRP